MALFESQNADIFPWEPVHRQKTDIVYLRSCMNHCNAADSSELVVLKKRVAELEAKEARLQADQEYLRQLYERAPLAYQSLDCNGFFIEVNQAWLEALGYTREEVIGRHFGDFLHPDWRDHFKENFSRFKAVGEILGIEFEMARKDGSTILVSFHGKIGKDPEGQFQQTHCIFQDITRRRLSETASRESGERLQAILESLGEGVILQDASERILLFNRTAAELFDIQADEISGQLASSRKWDTIREDGSLFHAQDHPSLHTLRTGEPCNGVIMGIRKSELDTKWIKINTRPLFAQGEAKPYAAIISFSDITEHKRTEIVLRERKAYLRSILRAAPIGIGVTRDRILQEVNTRLCEMTGYTEDELIAHDARMLYSDETAYQWVGEEKYKQIVQHGTGTVETRWRCKDGNCIDVLLSSTLIAKEDLARGVTFTALDITERKGMEAQLLAVNADLERRVEQRTFELQETQKKFLHAEKLSAIGKLSASIAHEFNNPLQGILSILKGIQKRAAMDEEDRRLLQAAIHENLRIKDLIHTLQDFNRPTSGKKTVIDLHQVIDSILLLNKYDFKSRGISVVLEYAEQLPQILAVSDQIKQILLNLLSNATDACHAPGATITISTWREDDQVALQIKDTGIGIKPENMGRIFEPFYTTKPEVKVTGLGLPVVYGIVKYHQGTIHVVSEPGEGTQFTLRLPIKGAIDVPSRCPNGT
jgi:PAS domain S-box-containing protein